jgi:hypothetical protein
VSNVPVPNGRVEREKSNPIPQFLKGECLKFVVAAQAQWLPTISNLR